MEGFSLCAHSTELNKMSQNNYIASRQSGQQRRGEGAILIDPAVFILAPPPRQQAAIPSHSQAAYVVPKQHEFLTNRPSVSQSYRLKQSSRMQRVCTSQAS